MTHLRYLFLGIISCFLVFFVIGQGTFQLLKPLVAQSKFRLAVACNADVSIPFSKKAYLFMGNSRVMGGINTNFLQKKDEERVFYNLAFNGLTFSDIKALMRSFQKSYSGTIDSIFINASALPRLDLNDTNPSGHITDIQMFLTAFNPEIRNNLFKFDPKRFLMLDIFPLIQFNNEFFMRSLYYFLTGKSDQEYSNNYIFKLTDTMLYRLRRTRFKANFDRQQISEFKNSLSSQGIKLVIIIPPFHPDYVKNVLGFDSGVNKLQLLSQDLGIEFYNHSKLYMNNEIFFGDPKHINTSGQKAYTTYLFKNVLTKSRKTL